ncbi:hypothetical protein C7401_109145 [Paraburkholderia unamae]|nr:hypothetical protein C7401_109145 [Paraburkholderia unamae]
MLFVLTTTTSGSEDRTQADLPRAPPTLLCGVARAACIVHAAPCPGAGLLRWSMPPVLVDAVLQASDI